MGMVWVLAFTPAKTKQTKQKNDMRKHTRAVRHIKKVVGPFGVIPQFLEDMQRSLGGNNMSWAFSWLRSARATMQDRHGEYDGTKYRLQLRRAERTQKLRFSESLVGTLQRLADRGDLVAQAVLNVNAWRSHSRNVCGDFFTLREKEGMISYCPKGREQTYTESGAWARAGRQDMKIGKWVRSILPAWSLKQFGDHDINAFSTACLAEEEVERLRFELVEGVEELNRIYDAFVRTDSCMKNDPVGEFYALAGAQVLACWQRGECVGRAVVWPEATICGETGVFMDRVYSADQNPVIETAFLDYARTAGWWMKEQQSMSAKRGFVSPSGGAVHGPASVEVGDIGRAEYYPFVDTFAYEFGGELRNSSGGDHEYEYTCTSGDREAGHAGEECIDGDWHPVGEVVTDVDGVRRHQDDVTWCEEDDEYYADGDDRICYCERSGETILTSNSYTVEVSRSMTYTVHERYVTCNG